jgi:hypothetical protein
LYLDHIDEDLGNEEGTQIHSSMDSLIELELVILEGRSFNYLKAGIKYLKGTRDLGLSWNDLMYISILIRTVILNHGGGTQTGYLSEIFTCT